MPGAASDPGEAGLLDPAGGAEVVEQRAFAGRADALDFVEFAGDERLGASGAMGGDGEAVGFIAEALEE
jgi:hypothetical protein